VVCTVFETSDDDGYWLITCMEILATNRESFFVVKVRSAHLGYMAHNVPQLFPDRMESSSLAPEGTKTEASCSYAHLLRDNFWE
jgi:hypothetical protein